MATRYVDSYQKNNENRGQLQLSLVTLIKTL
jgi:hypothetical protein